MSRKESLGRRTSSPRHTKGPSHGTSIEPFDAAKAYHALKGREAAGVYRTAVRAAALAYFEPWLDESLRKLVQAMEKPPKIPKGRLTPLPSTDPLPRWVGQELVFWISLKDIPDEFHDLLEHIPRSELAMELLADPPFPFTRAFIDVHRAFVAAAQVMVEDYRSVGFHALLGEPIFRLTCFGLLSIGRGDLIAQHSFDSITSIAIFEALARGHAFLGTLRARAARPKRKGARPDLVARAFCHCVCETLSPDVPTGKELALLAAAAGIKPLRSTKELEAAAKTWDMTRLRLIRSAWYRRRPRPAGATAARQ